MINKKNNKKNISGSKGLIFITEILENFFNQMLRYYKNENVDKEDIALDVLLKRLREGKRLTKKGNSIIKDIQKDLNSLNTILTSIPFVDESISKAKDALKGVSDAAEKATIEISDASVSMQDSLDRVNNFLNELEKMEECSQPVKEKVKSCIDEISDVADTAFNIMTMLQFQDILRQQLSAVALILSKVKNKITKSIERIEGLPIEIEEEEDYFVATDPSVLEKKESQDKIDSIVSEVKDDKESSK